MGISYSTPKSATRQPEEQTSHDSGTARYSYDSRLLNFSKINGKHNSNSSTPVQPRKISPTMHRSGSSPKGNDSSLQSLAGSPLLSSGTNTYLDPMMYVNINSPGFVSRVVDSADRSAEASLSGQSRYNGVGRFPRVQLGGSSPLPTLSSKNSQKFGKGTVHVRIAPPSSTNLYERRSSSSFSVPDESMKSVMKSLQEKSRKRIYSQCQETEEYNLKKKQRKAEGSFSEVNRDGQQYRHNRSSSVGSSPNPVLQIIDPVLQAKRAREEESPNESMKRQKKRVVTYNNEILSSLSSSRALLQRLSANKRKPAEWDGQNTNALNKQFKENVDISTPQSPSRWVQQSKTSRENLVSPKTPLIKSPEQTESRTPAKDDVAVVDLFDEEEETAKSLKSTQTKSSRVALKETDTPKTINKKEDVDLSSKLFRKNGTVKAKPRTAPASPWSHAAPAADELTCSLDKSGDKALERPQRFHGLLARMRGDGPASPCSTSTTTISPASKTAVSSSSLLTTSTPTPNSNDKKPGATLFTMTTPVSAAVPNLPAIAEKNTPSTSDTSTSPTAVSSSSAPLPTTNSPSSSEGGFGGFSYSSTINTRSVSSPLFGSTQLTSQASPVAITSTTKSTSRPVSSPSSECKTPTSESGSLPEASATTTATPSLPTLKAASANTNATSKASVSVTTASSSSKTTPAFGVEPATPALNFGSATHGPASSTSKTASVSVAPTPPVSTTTLTAPTFNFSGGSDAAKPAAPTFQFGASNPALPTAGVSSATAPKPTFSFGATPTPTVTTSSSSVLGGVGSAFASTNEAASSTSTSAAPAFTFAASTTAAPTISAAVTSTATSSAPNAPNAGIFSFTSGSNAKQETPAVQLGSIATSKTTPFAFGTPSVSTTTTTQTTATPTFGAAATSQAPAAQPVFGGFNAPGSTATTPSQVPPVFSFGSSASTTSAAPVFGAPTPSATAAAPALAPTPAFGSNFVAATTTSAPTSAPTFGANSAPAFGSTATSTAPTFGATSAPTFGGTSSGFGATPAPSFGAPSTPAFGATSTPAFGAVTTTSAPMFGAGSTSTLSFGAPSTPSFGGSTPSFGATATTSAPTMFGAPSCTPAFGATSPPAFGAPVTTAAPTFGAAQSGTPSFSVSTSAFGTPQTGVFGNTSTQAATGAFGASTSGVSSFGSSTPTPTFGATPAPSFGSTPTAAPSTPAFGATAPATPSTGNAPAFQFGAPSATPTQPTFNFSAGSSQSTPGTSQGFNFSAAPAAPAFQFGSAGPSPSPAPGPLFGPADGSANAVGGLPFGSAVAPVPVQLGVFPMGAGMFHIGTGSSNVSQRPRQTARRRK